MFKSLDQDPQSNKSRFDGLPKGAKCRNVKQPGFTIHSRTVAAQNFDTFEDWHRTLRGDEYCIVYCAKEILQPLFEKLRSEKWPAVAVLNKDKGDNSKRVKILGYEKLINPRKENGKWPLVGTIYYNVSKLPTVADVEKLHSSLGVKFYYSWNIDGKQQVAARKK